MYNIITPFRFINFDESQRKNKVKYSFSKTKRKEN